METIHRVAIWVTRVSGLNITITMINEYSYLHTMYYFILSDVSKKGSLSGSGLNDFFENPYRGFRFHLDKLLEQTC